MRKVIQFFLKSSSTGQHTKALLITAVSLSLLGGVANIGLVALVASMLSGHAGVTWIFVSSLLGLGIFLGITRGGATYLLTKVTIDTLVFVRMGFCAKVASSPLAVLERLGGARLTAAFTESMPAISNALVQLPNAVLYAIAVAGSIGYMAWLSWKALLLILVAGSAFIYAYRAVDRRAQAEFGKAFGHYRAVLKGFRELVDGAKELKLHRARRKAHLASAIATPMNGLARHRTRSSVLWGAAEAWSTAGMFFAIAAILAIARAQREVSTGFVLSLLYLTPFVQGILATLPAFSQAESAIKTLTELTGELSQNSDIADSDSQTISPWRRIALEGVEYRYNAGDADSTFRIGPVDFTLHAGETVFVTGGNGSGKTTLVKVLAGLYRPDAGLILVDGVPVSNHDLDTYRQNFSAVFFDFHVFDQLYGLAEVDEQAAAYLKHLKLDHKVKIEGGKLSTVDLSQGQKKRLALLTAYLEDRPIYVFDEWAADQDVEFREVFYHAIIPGLKRRNKTVIVISHDERYFHVADRVVKLDCGRLTQEPLEEDVEESFSMA
ncbi:MAG TPA: cyclic peptide export ABC transporter [Candidatus Angelobacter sp.]